MPGGGVGQLNTEAGLTDDTADHHLSRVHWSSDQGTS